MNSQRDSGASEIHAGAKAFKDRFFERYRSTHVGHRKPPSTRARLERRARVWRRHFGDLIPRNRKAVILDVGCGEGSFLWWLDRLGYTNSRGIEISTEELAVAQGLGVRAERADLWDVVGAQPGAFDLILYRNVLEHFDRPQVVDILERSRVALSAGGRIVLQVPNGESPFFGRIRYGDFTHELAFTRSSITQVLQMAGFHKIQVRPVPPVPETALGRLRIPLWKAVAILYRVLLFAEVGRGGGVITLDLIAVGEKPGDA
ncbi:MAG TPA: class I SAM-dependent methyltransferase [Vicinamibacterales bacterium]|nr:class I SAM-dependent methyltransferase [Vicinamibacterales bacterium]